MTTLRPELLDELLADYETPEDLLGDDGLFKQLKKALLERALGSRPPTFRIVTMLLTCSAPSAVAFRGCAIPMAIRPASQPPLHCSK